jgi:hypothetical protein
MGTTSITRLALVDVLGAFAALFTVVEIARRAFERDLATARLTRHPGAVSWGEVWDHAEPEAKVA